jgi:hypothetical protein
MCAAAFLPEKTTGPCDAIGGGERNRTDDLLRARQALSQLSYTPDQRQWWAWMELNHRPHAYQACALTELSYRPRHPLG